MNRHTALRLGGRFLSIYLVVGSAACLDPFPDQPTTPSTRKPSLPDGGAPTATDGGGKKPKQSYEQAWSLICAAEQRAPMATGASWDQRGTAVANWIVANLKNKQARYWWIAFGKAKPYEKRALFEGEAKRAGISDCALSTLLFARPPATDAGLPDARKPAPDGA